MGEEEITIVIDAGARYGMHPSWKDFAGKLKYFAFEPDKKEAERLCKQKHNPGFQIFDLGLDKTEGEKELRLAKHKGCSSFLEIDNNSEWFGNYRPGEGEIESIVKVRTTSVDKFAELKNVNIDFIKVDTEGTELDILKGAEQQLSNNILGVRAGVNFLTAYKNQPLFQDTHQYLLSKDFFLLNLDYFGRGVPKYNLFRNPDPQSPDNERYGVLVSTDGVWLKKYNWIMNEYAQNSDKLACTILKYAYFGILNNAADVGLDVLMKFVKDQNNGFSSSVKDSELYNGLRKTYATFLGRWRVYLDSQWDLARSTFKSIFGLELEGGNQYWEFIQSL